MSKIAVAGDAVVIVSSMKLEDLKKIQASKPDALVLKDKDGNQEFAVSTGCHGEAGKYGVIFNAESNDGSGLACVTVARPALAEDETIEDAIVDAYGAAITQLNAVEAGLPEVLKEIDKARAEIKSQVTVLA